MKGVWQIYRIFFRYVNVYWHVSIGCIFLFKVYVVAVLILLSQFQKWHRSFAECLMWGVNSGFNFTHFTRWNRVFASICDVKLLWSTSLSMLSSRLLYIRCLTLTLNLLVCELGKWWHLTSQITSSSLASSHWFEGLVFRLRSKKRGSISYELWWNHYAIFL